MDDVAAVPANHPYPAELEAERQGWYELVGLVRSITPAECLVPGYYLDPDWNVRDLVAHLGTWLAQAQVELEQIRAGTHVRREIDVDALNAALLEAMDDQPWDVCWIQANAARTKMIEAWRVLVAPSPDAWWWITKSTAEHYGQHLGRLREWTADLIGRR